MLSQLFGALDGAHAIRRNPAFAFRGSQESIRSIGQKLDADYVVTGAWSKKAAEEAKKYGKVNVIATSKDKNFSYVPDLSDLPIDENADYVYICENETIHGTT